MCELAEHSGVGSLFINFILDFSLESKENFVESISMMLACCSGKKFKKCCGR